MLASLAPPHVDARRVPPPASDHSGLSHVGDDRVFERHHQLPHSQCMTAQIEQRVDQELSGSVIGHLTAAVDLYHRDIAG